MPMMLAGPPKRHPFSGRKKLKIIGMGGVSCFGMLLKVLSRPRPDPARSGKGPGGRAGPMMPFGGGVGGPARPAPLLKQGPPPWRTHRGALPDLRADAAGPFGLCGGVGGLGGG